MNAESANVKDIRKFGLIALCFFGILCAVGIWREKVFVTYFFGFLALLGLGLVILPHQLKPVYNGWLRVAHFIGKAVTTSMLALTYYIVMTPAALLKRIFGGRPLPVKPDRSAVTYWVDRQEPAQPKERFLKRY